MAYVEDGFLNVTYFVSEKVYRNHWNTRTFVLTVFKNILGIGVLGAEVLPKSQGFCFEPRLLQFYQYEFCGTIVFLDPRSEIYAKHRDVVAASVGVFVASHVNVQHLFFQQS